MIRSIAVLLLFAIFAQTDPPALYVVSARDTVYPGQVFSITITQFGAVGDVTFDPGGMSVITDTATLPTRYVWLRATGPARDVTVRAWGRGVDASAVVRVCCRVTAWPGVRLWLAVVRR